MTAGDRVRYSDEFDRGTVERVSAIGYVSVAWDDGTFGLYTPATAGKVLTPVVGDDALPRHAWGRYTADGVDATCTRCGIDQTDDNFGASCAASAPTARVP